MAVGSYYEQFKVKDDADIKSTEDDGKLNQFGTNQNQRIESMLSVYADTLAQLTAMW